MTCAACGESPQVPPLKKLRNIQHRNIQPRRLVAASSRTRQFWERQTRRCTTSQRIGPSARLMLSSARATTCNRPSARTSKPASVLRSALAAKPRKRCCSAPMSSAQRCALLATTTCGHSRYEARLRCLAVAIFQNETGSDPLLPPTSDLSWQWSCCLRKDTIPCCSWRAG